MDKFGGNQLIYESYLRSEIEIKEYEDKQAMKAYAYYKNNIVDIKNFLNEYLGSIINPNSLARMPKIVLNYIPKIVKRLTLAYGVSPISETGVKNYAEVTRNLNKWRKEFHRQGKLFNTVLIRPIYNEEKNYFNYMILSRAHCNVITDPLDKNVMKELNYKIEYPRNEKNEEFVIHWTDDSHWATDKNDNPAKLDFMPDDNKNPYKKIPFIRLKLSDSMDFWGDGMIDVVQGNEHLNGRMTDTFWKLYMSFGIPVGTNLGIKSDQFYLSPDMPIMIDNARAEMAAPNLDFKTPDQNIEIDKLVSDWFINEMGISKGLSAGSFTEKETATSGYSKMIDNLELIDLNEDDKDALREMESDLFEMQKIVLDVDGKGDLGKKLNFEFRPFEFPKSDVEIWQNREKEFQYNISTPIDWLREYRPDATDEELQQQLKDNQTTNSEMKRTLTRLETIVNGRNQAQ